MDYTIEVGVEKKMTRGDDMPYFKEFMISGNENREYLRGILDGQFVQYIDTIKRYTIKKVIYNYPATIVFWADGSKTVVKSMLPDYESTEEQGLFWAIAKKVVGSTAALNRIIDNIEIQNYEDH